MTASADSTAAGITWWDHLTSSVGEGMMVKSSVNLHRTRRGLAPPGNKVRGREYLREGCHLSVGAVSSEDRVGRLSSWWFARSRWLMSDGFLDWSGWVLHRLLN